MLRQALLCRHTCNLFLNKSLLENNYNLFISLFYRQKSDIFRKFQKPRKDFQKVTSSNENKGYRKLNNNSKLTGDIIKEEVDKNLKKLKKDLFNRGEFSSFKSRKLINSMQNLRAAYGEISTKIDSSKEMKIPPSKIFLEIIGNGSYNLSSSLLIRTENNIYLINIPEGTTRSTHLSRIKPSNVKDIFITRPTINNIAGLPGFILTKESADNLGSRTRFHGVSQMVQFAKAIQPISDEDFGRKKISTTFDIISPEEGMFSDEAFDIKYIPITSTIDSPTISYCFLFEAKLPQKKINPLKLVELNIPKGPWLGRLKNGETVILPDDRTIRPEDVLFDHDFSKERPNLLVLDVQSIDEIKSLDRSSHLFQYIDGKKILNYVVHNVNNFVYNSKEYQLFKKKISFSTTKHIIVNETAQYWPSNDGMYHIIKYNNDICPELFPLPYGYDSNLSFTSDDDYNREDLDLVVKNFARFPMRGTPHSDDVMKFNIGLFSTHFALTPQNADDLEKSLKDFRFEICQNEKLKTNDIYPELSVLGTSSAVPSKYRNVSSYLLKTSDTSSFLVDIGESTYTQLFYQYGPSKIKDILTQIKACFITHAHQDHVNGIGNFVMKRKEAFDSQNIPYIPLIIVGNSNVQKYINSYDFYMSKISQHIKFVHNFRKINPENTLGNNVRQPLAFDVENVLPFDLYNPEEWNLKNIKAVPVKHMGAANGYILTDTKDRKFVFSGDTMPCDLLVREGMNADILIHEATFEDDFEKEAFRKKHSTIKQAVTVGKEMNAKYTLLTHFSARYHKVPMLPEYLEENNAGIAFDLMRIKFNQWEIVPKLNKLFRIAYASELFDLETKLHQRILVTNDQIKRKSTEKDVPPSKKLC
uniref:ribonuclease Z n=1 Tax=Parastrongyloides trichosuri TaxID=131310 RepID=A0A0N4ZYN2_PARTI